ncbi:MULTISPECIES: proteophosphoglycan ppg4 [unclassified Variovorax]|jgi:hypothetical protein|uniref:proteophosphoglycan ppg4 n=1 Tax=unclassified Variovorax TaxID=663243 RepID=UPI00131A6534|nr:MULTISPECIES: proteophosphoglycan ppg4 [unclassified Variovorax]QRY34970.1 proteophosphoglycan ppg4 [Variovorax sp. PDNC026]
MTHFSAKTLLATAAFVVAGGALAQGTQPNPNVANPATGAGQQSQQGTPMGTTGVLPANNGATAMPNNSMNAAPAARMANDSADMAPQRRMRAARADRN